MERIDGLPSLPPRRRDAHKGDFGHVLVVGGSRGMAGAPCLAGEAALRAGAGLATVAVPSHLYPVVAAKLTCCMTHPLPEDASTGGLDVSAAEGLADLAERFDVLALGPGLGRGAGAAHCARVLAERAARPTVIDADGLNALAGAAESLAAAPAPRVLTPHPGEMARLLGLPSARAVQADRLGAAAELARRARAVVVLKGQETVVSDGPRYAINATGNPGMATGGTGDVLTGVIAALLAQGLAPFAAARLGAHVHGLAGDLAAAARGEVSLVATDLLEWLPAAFRALERRPPREGPAMA